MRLGRLYIGSVQIKPFSPMRYLNTTHVVYQIMKKEIKVKI